MRTLTLSLVGGALLGIAIHIAIVLMVPHFATHDSWSQMQTRGKALEFHLLPTPVADSPDLATLDPAMEHAVCTFDLAGGPVFVTAELPNAFWSAAVFDRFGKVVFSLNDGSADRTGLELAIITPVQMAQLRQDPPRYLETAIVVQHDMSAGYVLLRAFAPDFASLERTRIALQASSCGLL